MKCSTTTCHLVNTYEVLEHVLEIEGLHPHSLKTIESIHHEINLHTKGQRGVILDVGCGSGRATKKLASMLLSDISVVGIDINDSAIQKAKESHSSYTNLSFYHGSLESFYTDNPDLKILAILCVSVSMFFPSVKDFYTLSYKMLTPNGMFVDAPFVFNENSLISEPFKQKTYGVCGCSLDMQTTKDLAKVLVISGFQQVKLDTSDFELMKFKNLSLEYGLRRLFTNFLKNTLIPQYRFEAHSAWYLVKRTLGIFTFFMKNRTLYESGVIYGFKRV